MTLADETGDHFYNINHLKRLIAAPNFFHAVIEAFLTFMSPRRSDFLLWKLSFWLLRAERSQVVTGPPLDFSYLSSSPASSFGVLAVLLSLIMSLL